MQPRATEKNCRAQEIVGRAKVAYWNSCQRRLALLLIVEYGLRQRRRNGGGPDAAAKGASVIVGCL